MDEMERLCNIQNDLNEWGSVDGEDSRWMIKTIKQQQEQIQQLQNKEHALNQLVSKWNDYANNGTEQEQAEFFHEFRQTLNEIAFEKRDEHE